MTKSKLMARYFSNSKTAMWTQTYQLRLKNFLSRKVFQKISKSKKDGLIDWIKSVSVGESKLCQRLAAKFGAEKQWI